MGTYHDECALGGFEIYSCHIHPFSIQEDFEELPLIILLRTSQPPSPVVIGLSSETAEDQGRLVRSACETRVSHKRLALLARDHFQ